MENMFRLANLFGLDVDNKQHSIAIVDALKGMTDIGGFIAFVRENREAIKYTGKTEKLDILAERYKELELDARLADIYAKGDKYAVALAKKVKECRHVVDSSGCGWKHIRLDGKPFFKEHELRILDEVGYRVIEYARTWELEEKIAEVYKNKVKQNERKALAGGTHKDVLKIANVARKF